jgi:hypothetical protein
MLVAISARRDPLDSPLIDLASVMNVPKGLPDAATSTPRCRSGRACALCNVGDSAPRLPRRARTTMSTAAQTTAPSVASRALGSVPLAGRLLPDCVKTSRCRIAQSVSDVRVVERCAMVMVLCSRCQIFGANVYALSNYRRIRDVIWRRVVQPLAYLATGRTQAAPCAFLLAIRSFATPDRGPALLIVSCAPPYCCQNFTIETDSQR